MVDMGSCSVVKLVLQASWVSFCFALAVKDRWTMTPG